MSETVIEHPFFDDYVQAFQSVAIKKLDIEIRERLRKVQCTLFPSSILEKRWQGWEIGIPRPAEFFPREFLSLLQEDVTRLLMDFFKRVERGMLYCDYSAVAEKFGGENVENRMGKISGLHFNLEAAYWTFNVKFNQWIWQNTKAYNCSLVCPLDEVFARFDSDLRVAFFPTPGPLDIGSRKRRKLQKQILDQFAPTIERPLMEQIWRRR